MLLSRPLSIVIVAVLYCPPWYNADLCSKLSRYLVNCVDELHRKYNHKSDFFDIPVTLPPLGRSDHVCIHLKPKHRQTSLSTIAPVMRRNLCDSVIDQIGFDLVHVRWVDMFRLDDVQSQADFFLFYCVIHC